MFKNYLNILFGLVCLVLSGGLSALEDDVLFLAGNEFNFPSSANCEKVCVTPLRQPKIARPGDENICFTRPSINSPNFMIKRYLEKCCLSVKTVCH